LPPSTTRSPDGYTPFFGLPFFFLETFRILVRITHLTPLLLGIVLPPKPDPAVSEAVFGSQTTFADG